MKLERGDVFEMEHAEWIRQKLPFYEDVWSAFIGHNGKGQMLEMPGLTEGQEEKRKVFGQAHYSLVVSLFQVERLVLRTRNEFNPVKSLEQFLNEYECLFLFVAYVGHIRDMFKTIDVVLGSEHHGALQDFYAQRSHVLHSPRLPVSFDDISWLMPKIAKQNEQAGEWHCKAAWDSVTFKNGKYSNDFICEAFDELLALIQMLHPKIFSTADKFFGKRRVQEIEVFEQPKTFGVSLGSNASQMNISTAASGVCYAKPRKRN
jgi:hypothetical protein